jgi:glycosyltransferase involved in cell wall biosynthesis
VPEVIEPGRGGVIVGDWGEAVAALEQTDLITPESCRAYAEERFKPERMVADYLAAFESLLAS